MRPARAESRLAEARLAGDGSAAAPANGQRDFAEAARIATVAQRRRLSELRSDGTIGDDALHNIEEELDRAELGAEAMDPER